MSLSLELIAEFKGRNTGYRVLPDGQIETSGQGAGKIMGIDAMMLFTTVGLMSDGLFMGEGTGVITTMAGEALTLQMNSIGLSSGNGGVSRGASTQVTSSEILARLNRVICLHEYRTDLTDNWVGKIWVWK